MMQLTKKKRDLKNTVAIRTENSVKSRLGVVALAYLS